MAFRLSVAKLILSLPTTLVGLALSSNVLAQETAPTPASPAAAPATPPTASTAPPASQAKEKAEGDDGPGFGVYVEGNGAAMFSFSSTHEWKDDCPAGNIGSESWAPNCSASAPMGLLVDGRLGFRFGYLGVELMGVFAGDWSRASFDESVPGLSVDSTMDVGRVGGGLGAGLRVMTSPGMARISAGAGGGALLRHVYSTVSSLDGQSESYLAPYIMGDVTVTLLSFINIGVVAMVEFAPDVTLQPDFSSLDVPGTDVLEDAIGPITVFQGPQFFIGPRVGLHFGG